MRRHGDGSLAPVIAVVRILSGGEWPGVDEEDAVPLGDFTFGLPVPSTG